ncbi:MAG: hypothetical protein ACKOE8_15990 [Opitutaceae bacterium]
MTRRLAILATALALAALATGAWAAPLTRDLGDGLTYVRVRELPADLPGGAAAPGQALIVDLRYLAAGRDAAAALLAWAEFRASVRSPLFLLANRETGAELNAALRRVARGKGCVVIGVPGPGFEPQLAAKSEPAAEREAYAALERGEPVMSLLTENPGKVRLDEASLNHPPAEEEDAPAAEAAKPAPPIDAALQRAFHLHRSLRALRRL